jgi:hypothetical protein
MVSRQATTVVPALVLLLLTLAVPGAVNGQIAGGSIKGTITGESGAAIPEVQISLRDVATDAIRTDTSNTNGFFNLPALPPGHYEMTITCPGYVTHILTAITVAVETERVLNVVMRAGDPKVVMQTAASSVPVSQASGGNVDASTVRDTPLNGRDWAQLVTLQAGVTGVQTSSDANALDVKRGFGASISISGARPDQNSYRLDGISINDYANGAPGSVLGDNLGIDAVEQVSVLGSNYPAEYGRTSGGLINAVTRSGKNSFHGTAYEFLRNSALDARNFFDGPIIPPFKRNQFGASAGLPLRKDRTFIFGDYEGLRQSLGLTSVNTVPSRTALGILPSGTAPSVPAVMCSNPQGALNTCSTHPVTGAFNPDPTTGVDTSVLRFIRAFYPLPNGPDLGNGDTGFFTFAGQQITPEDYFTVRLDHKFSDKDSFTGTFMRDNSQTIQPSTFDELRTKVVSARMVATLQEQHVFSPGFLNIARFGFSRAVGIKGGISKVSNPLMLDPSYTFVPGALAGDIEDLPGVTTFAGAPSVQGLFSSSSTLVWNSYQAGDDIYITKGRHSIKFGGVVERMQENQLILSLVNGSYRFATLENFLMNKPQSFQGVRTLNPPEFGVRQTLAGGYFQDDIRLKPTLTVNLGVRYEMATVLKEAHDRITNLRNLTDAQPYIGSPFYHNQTLRNFEPRVGFAWNPGGGRTLIRSGFGMFDVLPLPYEFAISYQYGTPFVQQIFGSDLPAGSFPTDAFQQLAAQPNSLRSLYVEQNPKRDYVMQWNLSVAQELSSTMVLTLTYVGSRGVHQPYKMDNINMVLPTLTSTGYQWPCGPDGTGNPCASRYKPTGTQANPIQTVTLNPNFGRISANLWQANSFYHALQANLTKRVSRGFQFRAAYTWGKSIDTLSATAADDVFPNGIRNPPFFDQRTTRGLSDFDVAQSAVMSFTWELPSPSWGTSAAQPGGATSLRLLMIPRWALSGWQLGGVYKISTGQPFSPTSGGDPLGTRLETAGDPPDVVNGPGCETLINPGNPNHYVKTQCLSFPNPGTRRGNLGRNALIGPGISKLDFSVFKNNHIYRKNSSNSSGPNCTGSGCGNSNFSSLFSEDFNIQFRAELFNILNHANFSSPTDNNIYFDKNGQPIPSGGLITSTQTTSRQIQLAIKIIW